MSCKRITVSMPKVFYDVAIRKSVLRYSTFSSYITHLIAMDNQEDIKKEYEILKKQKSITNGTLK